MKTTYFEPQLDIFNAIGCHY